MTKTINDFLTTDDLMLAGPAENAPSDYWSKPADEITAPVKVNYGRYAGRRAVPAGILGAGIAYGTYENE